MAADFFSRWSARKQEARAGRPVDEPQRPPSGPGAAPADSAPLQPPVPVGGPPAAALSVNSPGGSGDAERAPSVQQPGAEAPALPTLEQARQLTPQSDFSPFVARGVAPEVRNLALKKLFADPHFNVMDRLDTYIDDYSIADPLPPGMLGQLAGARFLNLVQPDEAQPAAAAASLRDDASTRPAPAVPESGTANPLPAGAPAQADPDPEPGTEPRPPHERA